MFLFKQPINPVNIPPSPNIKKTVLIGKISDKIPTSAAETAVIPDTAKWTIENNLPWYALGVYFCKIVVLETVMMGIPNP